VKAKTGSKKKTMSEKDFDLILDECLDCLIEGGSVEDCLGLYPELAGELEPLLLTVDEVRTGGDFRPSESAMARGRARLRREIAQTEGMPAEPSLPFFQWLFAQPRIWAPAVAAVLVLIIVLAATGVFSGGTTDDDVVGLPPDTDTPDSTTPVVAASTGILEMWVTDAPAYDISAVDVTISDIQVHRAGGDGGAFPPVEPGTLSEETGDDGWDTVVSGTMSFELLALRGVEDLLGSQELEAGHYTQIRLNLIEVLVTAGSEVYTAQISSEKLKLVSSFDVEADTVTRLVMDMTGSDKFIFKPTIKLDASYSPLEEDNNEADETAPGNQPDQGNDAAGAPKGKGKPGDEEPTPDEGDES